MKSNNYLIWLVFALGSSFIQAEPQVSEQTNVEAPAKHPLQLDQNSYDWKQMPRGSSQKSVPSTGRTFNRNLPHTSRLANRPKMPAYKGLYGNASARQGHINRLEARGENQPPAGQTKPGANGEKIEHFRLSDGKFGGKAWWGNLGDAVYAPTFVWPTAPVFENFFTSELALLPTLNLAPNVLGELMEEIETMKATVTQLGLQSTDTRKRVGALLGKIADNDANVDLQGLFGSATQNKAPEAPSSGGP